MSRTYLVLSILNAGSYIFKGRTNRTGLTSGSQTQNLTRGIPRQHHFQWNVTAAISHPNVQPTWATGSPGRLTGRRRPNPEGGD